MKHVFRIIRHGDFKDSARRSTFDEVSDDKAFKFVIEQKFDTNQRELSSMVY